MTLRYLLGALACALTFAGPAYGATNAETPIPVSPSDTPPAGRHLSANRVLAIADRLPKMRAVRARNPGSYGGAYLKGPARWQVSYFSKRNQEIGQVIIADLDGRVLEQWTGFQIAWQMARGYPGAFGRHVNALYIWLPLCALFFVPFFDWRKPLRLLHLDLLVLLSFSVSLAFFNHARIGLSTPLAYPPLVYLLARMLMLTRRSNWRAGRSPRFLGRQSALGRGSTIGSQSAVGSQSAIGRGSVLGPQSAQGARLLVPAPWLAVGVLFLLGFRIGLNVTDSNVIDVGYAGVIGAQRIVQDRPLYGHWPSDNEHGDTYGPVNYEAYVPFQQIFGWSGRWDDLPAAHGAAIAFDLLAIVLLFLLGRRVRGPSLGIALAYAWVSYPFTLFALESNSNDTLLAALVLAALLVASSPPARGALGALASLTKFAPLALSPLLATHRMWEHSGRRRARALALFAMAFVGAGALASLSALSHDTLHTIVHRTLAYQADRESPFSIWGLYGGGPALGDLQAAVQGAALALAFGLAIVPRRSDLVGLAAAAAAALIAVQLGVNHWFYLYIPWFFGLSMLALLGSGLGDRRPASGLQAVSGSASGLREAASPATAVSTAGRPGRPMSMAWPSVSARSSRLAAA